jgi:hypothetical protein
MYETAYSCWQRLKLSADADAVAAGLVGDNQFTEGFVSGLLLIFFSEIGDKTFFIALLLALKQVRNDNSTQLTCSAVPGRLRMTQQSAAVNSRTLLSAGHCLTTAWFTDPAADNPATGFASQAWA